VEQQSLLKGVCTISLVNVVAEGVLAFHDDLFALRVAAALRPAALRFLVCAALTPAALRFAAVAFRALVSTAFAAALLRFRVLAAFCPAVNSFSSAIWFCSYKVGCQLSG
jgi:hypothetical protein